MPCKSKCLINYMVRQSKPTRVVLLFKLLNQLLLSRSEPFRLWFSGIADKISQKCEGFFGEFTYLHLPQTIHNFSTTTLACTDLYGEVMFLIYIKDKSLKHSKQHLNNNNYMYIYICSRLCLFLCTYISFKYFISSLIDPIYLFTNTYINFNLSSLLRYDSIL